MNKFRPKSSLKPKNPFEQKHDYKQAIWKTMQYKFML